MKHPKRRSIQLILVSSFLTFSLLMLVLMSVIICRMQYTASREDTIQTLRQTALSVADSVTQHLNQMNQISLNAVSSRDMKDAFSRYFAPDIDAYERYQEHLHLANALTTAKGFDFSIRQLNVYTLTGEGFGVGEENDDLKENALDLAWYEKARDAHGLPVVTAADDYVSLSRMFFNGINVPLGFAEVKKNFDTVFALAENPGISYPVSIFVYDKDGNPLYPADSDMAEEMKQAFSGFGPEGDEELLQVSVSNKHQIVTFSHSEKLGLTVAVAAERRVYLRQVYSFLLRILPVFLLMFAVMLFLSIVVSRRISSPIRQIYHFLSDETKDRFSLLRTDYTNIREIDKLQDSINENIRSMKTSTDTLMILKEQEVQAQMLSLQSQMNPHFLYNSLSTIGEMAEEGMTEPVSRMCDRITEILRYISSNREQRSSLEEELEICDMFLDCLKMRYRDQLIGTISVSDEMLDLMIPKLCIQLLVENAIRSVTQQAPPWHVEVTCVQDDENWYVTVSDNGGGFDPEVDKRLRAQMDQILENGILPSLKIQGMGILNIFIRLYLLEGIPFVFDMGNLPEGGAFVRIGGRLDAARKETKEV